MRKNVLCPYERDDMKDSDRTPAFHDYIISLPFYLDLDLAFLVVHFKDAELLCIDKPLQFLHICPQHAFEIGPVIDDSDHNSFTRFPDAQVTRALINLVRCVC
jgi:hypothetical protein